jgi:hypothetical protein
MAATWGTLGAGAALNRSGSGLDVRVGRGGAGDLGRACRDGVREDGDDRRARFIRERKERCARGLSEGAVRALGRSGCVRWAGTAHTGEEREERRGRRAGRVLGRGKRERRERRGVEGSLGRGAAHAGRGGKGGPRERKGEGFWAGPAVPLSFLFFFPFSFLLSNHSNKSI